MACPRQCQSSRAGCHMHAAGGCASRERSGLTTALPPHHPPQAAWGLLDRDARGNERLLIRNYELSVLALPHLEEQCAARLVAGEPVLTKHRLPLVVGEEWARHWWMACLVAPTHALLLCALFAGRRSTQFTFSCTPPPDAAPPGPDPGALAVAAGPVCRYPGRPRPRCICCRRCPVTMHSSSSPLHSSRLSRPNNVSQRCMQPCRAECA